MARPRAPDRRLAAIAADLFVPAADRMSDRLRAYMSTMLDSVTDAFERGMRRSLHRHFVDHPELAASLASATVGIALSLLLDIRALAHPPLIGVVLRRAEEFVLSRRIVSEAQNAGPLVDDANPDIAAAAMALAIAESRRVDRFGAPALLVDDLPAEVAHWLVWRIAAALRHYLCVHHHIDPAEADGAVTEAATVVLAVHDEGAGLRTLATSLASRLAAAGRNDGPLLRSLLDSGGVGAFTAALAATAALPDDEVWKIVADPADGRLALVLRAADVDRGAAAAILLALTPDPVMEIDLFDAYGHADARAAVAVLALPPSYREAQATLDCALVLQGPGA